MLSEEAGERARERMAGWLQASGCVCGNVRMRWMGADRGWGGAACEAGLARGEILLAFPAGILLDASAAHRSALGPLLEKAAAAAAEAAATAAATGSAPAEELPRKARRPAGPKLPDAWAIILLLLRSGGCSVRGCSRCARIDTTLSVGRGAKRALRAGASRAAKRRASQRRSGSWYSTRTPSMTVQKS